MAPRVDFADRRRLVQALAMSAAWWSVPGAYAEQLVRTPAQTEGPFYPNHLPLDTDNDLIRINDLTTPAVGVVTWLSGRVLDVKGQPIRNALVEIWQVDNAGAYLHTGSVNREKRDANFQGFGRFVTGSSATDVTYAVDVWRRSPVSRSSDSTRTRISMLLRSTSVMHASITASWPTWIGARNDISSNAAVTIGSNRLLSKVKGKLVDLPCTR